MQAETARLTTPASRPRARRLETIGDTAGTRSTEMRRLLGVLRARRRTEAARAPQPGANGSPTWSTAPAKAGMAVLADLKVTGALPPASTWPPTGSSRRR